MLNRKPFVACFLALALLTVAACSSGRATSTNHVLVIDKAFDLKTADPQRDLSVTGSIIAKALYSTLLTFDGEDEATPVPWVASSYGSSDDATRFTFTLRRGVVFADGTPLTSADVVFSFNRLVNLKNRVSLQLAGVSASAPDASTVVFESKDPNAALPFILTNPALAIMNSRVVQDQGEDFLNSVSAGSGPYMLKSFSTVSGVELTANPRYWGPRPFYRKVLIRNLDALAQITNIASATDQVAMDLSPAQAGTLTRNPSVSIKAFAGPEVVFLFANDNAQVSSATSNKHFQNAVRFALDYSEMVQLMGAGAIQAAGVIPSKALGALPAWTAPHTDLDKARTELAA